MERDELPYEGLIHFYLCVIRKEDEIVGSFLESEAPHLESLALLEVCLCQLEGKFVVFPVLPELAEEDCLFDGSVGVDELEMAGKALRRCVLGGFPEAALVVVVAAVDAPERAFLFGRHHLPAKALSFADIGDWVVVKVQLGLHCLADGLEIDLLGILLFLLSLIEGGA